MQIVNLYKNLIYMSSKSYYLYIITGNLHDITNVPAAQLRATEAILLNFPIIRIKSIKLTFPIDFNDYVIVGSEFKISLVLSSNKSSATVLLNFLLNFVP